MERPKKGLHRRGSPILKAEPMMMDLTSPLDVLKQLQWMIEQMQTKIAEQEKTIQDLNAQIKALQGSPTVGRANPPPMLKVPVPAAGKSYSQPSSPTQIRHMDLFDEPSGTAVNLIVPEPPRDYVWGSVPEGVQLCAWEDSQVNVLQLLPQYGELEEYIAKRDIVEINRFIEDKQKKVKRGNRGNILFSPKGSQVPVNTPIETDVVFSLKERSTYSFRFVNVLSNKYQLTFSPNEGTLEPDNPAVRVKMTLVVLCTTILTLRIPIVFWRGLIGSYEYALAKKSKDEICCCRLQSHVQSKLSWSIDPEELTLFKDNRGSGSFGRVYRSNYRGQTVACKVLKRQDSVDTIDGFEREMEILYALHHPCVVNTIGAVNIPGVLCIVTEWCRFGSLREALQEYGASVWTPEMKVKALYDCACAMDFLHQSSIIHRDLKPDNLLVVSLDFAPVVCKLSDFGTTRWISKWVHTRRMTAYTGTPLFMAPEVLAGRSDYTIKADVYSFALTIASTIDDGKFPFDEMRYSESQLVNEVARGVRPVVRNQESVPHSLITLMEECWDADPKRRPTFSIIVTKLREILSSFQK